MLQNTRASERPFEHWWKQSDELNLMVERAAHSDTAGVLSTSRHVKPAAVNFQNDQVLSREMSEQKLKTQNQLVPFLPHVLSLGLLYHDLGWIPG